MKNKKIKNKAQVTIFIIIGVLIVVLGILIYMFYPDIKTTLGTESKNPSQFIQNCMEDKIKESIGILSLQGGSIKNPLNKTFRFSDEKDNQDISYLCYTNEKNKLCINQEAMLIEHVENEIHDYILEEVESCFNNLKSSLEKENYNVVGKYNGFEVNLKERGVFVKLNTEMTLTKTEETSTQKDFDVILNSKIYDILVVAQEIVNQEASSCDFNYALFMMNYPKFNIEKIRTSNSEVVYRILNKKSNEDFRFAIRGCVIST